MSKTETTPLTNGMAEAIACTESWKIYKSENDIQKDQVCGRADAFEHGWNEALNFAYGRKNRE